MPTIQEIVTSRGIDYLLHFTRVENLSGILARGLIPRSEFLGRQMTPLVCDEVRLDRCEGATSISIGFTPRQSSEQIQTKKARIRGPFW